MVKKKKLKMGMFYVCVCLFSSWYEELKYYTAEVVKNTFKDMFVCVCMSLHVSAHRLKRFKSKKKSFR